MTPAMISDDDRVWLPISRVAKEYNRSPETIRLWCVSGFLIELGFTIQRDLTGHWIIGIPQSVYSKFSNL